MAEDKNFRVRLIREEIKRLEPEVKKGDPTSVRRYAGFLVAAAGFERAMGKFEEAGEDYRAAASTLEKLKGASYMDSRSSIREYSHLANEMDDLVEKRKKESRLAYQASGYGAAVASAVVLILGGLALIVVPNITGYTVGDEVERNCNVFGLCMFVLGLIISYIFVALKRRK